VHDPISFDASRSTEPHLGYLRPTNHAGGLEGGMTNGMPVVVTGTMKPIATLLQGLPSVDLRTKDATRSQYERSDISAVAAASVVMQHAVGFEVARAFLEKFGGDSWDQVRASHDRFMAAARAL
jgi:chorismate synthase